MARSSRVTLKRCFGLKESITITVGTVIGVGLFTIGGNVVGLLGPLVIWATFAALLISIYPALLYAEMGAALPLAGGTYQYASLGLGRPFGMLAGWNFIIAMVSVASGEALAFSFYIRTFFAALGVNLPLNDSGIACLVIILFLILGIRGIKITGRLQNGFMFFFWGVAVVWVISLLPSISTANFIPAATTGFSVSGFIPCIALIWWCFAGFETCCALGEEIRYPQINLPRALILAPFIVFAVNGLFQWALLSIVPSAGLPLLIDAAAPYAEAMKQAGIIGFPLLLLCLGIALGGDFSTLNATIAASSRYLFTMARDGVLPQFFMRLHTRYRTPVFAILLLGALVLLLVSTNSITYIASLSLFATLFYYIIGIVAACFLRRKKPNLPRPFTAPLIWLGAPLSALIYLYMMTQLDKGAILAGLIWCGCGLLIYVIQSCRGALANSADSSFYLGATPESPTPAEKRQMDREYRRCSIAVGFAVIFVIALYLIAFLL